MLIAFNLIQTLFIQKREMVLSDDTLLLLSVFHFRSVFKHRGGIAFADRDVRYHCLTLHYLVFSYGIDTQSV